MSKAEALAHQPAQFEDAPAPMLAATGDVNLDVILDVPVTLSLEVGRTRVPIRNLLQLNQGSVVELERSASEPFDVFVNGRLCGSIGIVPVAAIVGGLSFVRRRSR